MFLYDYSSVEYNPKWKILMAVQLRVLPKLVPVRE